MKFYLALFVLLTALVDSPALAQLRWPQLLDDLGSGNPDKIAAALTLTENELFYQRDASIFWDHLQMRDKDLKERLNALTFDHSFSSLRSIALLARLGHALSERQFRVLTNELKNDQWLHGQKTAEYPSGARLSDDGPGRWRRVALAARFQAGARPHLLFALVDSAMKAKNHLYVVISLAQAVASMAMRSPDWARSEIDTFHFVDLVNALRLAVRSEIRRDAEFLRVLDIVDEIIYLFEEMKFLPRRNLTTDYLCRQSIINLPGSAIKNDLWGIF
jgi:hypothetical protein